jgi:hypothetical protein
MLPKPYYFIGDEAFSNTDQFLVPWSKSSTCSDVYKDSFNYHLSSMRQCIERSFAMLTQRWGIFWRPLRCSFNKWTLVCTVAAKLHNFLIDMDETFNTIQSRHKEDICDGDVHSIMLNGNFHDDFNVPQRPIGDRRREITDILSDAGKHRPHFYV